MSQKSQKRFLLHSHQKNFRIKSIFKEENQCHKYNLLKIIITHKKESGKNWKEWKKKNQKKKIISKMMMKKMKNKILLIWKSCFKISKILKKKPEIYQNLQSQFAYISSPQTLKALSLIKHL